MVSTFFLFSVSKSSSTSSSSFTDQTIIASPSFKPVNYRIQQNVIEIREIRNSYQNQLQCICKEFGGPNPGCVSGKNFKKVSKLSFAS